MDDANSRLESGADSLYYPVSRPDDAALIPNPFTQNSGHPQASVQRSHRFPLHLFAQIENLAKMGGVPVSLIINQLIESGLEAVKENLPPDTVARMTLITQKQLDRPMITDRVDVKKDRNTTQPKRTRAK